MASPTPTHVTSQTSLPHSPSAAHVALTAAPAATADAWESEAEALAVARGALRAGNTTEALARLETYFAAFPHGHLELEARVLRIRAYAKSEATRARARSEAAALRKAQPNSAYDEELKALLSP